MSGMREPLKEESKTLRAELHYRRQIHFPTYGG